MIDTHPEGLLLGVAVGDVRGVEWAVPAGGVLDVAAVLAFVAVAATSAVRRQVPVRT